MRTGKHGTHISTQYVSHECREWNRGGCSGPDRPGRGLDRAPLRCRYANLREREAGGRWDPAPRGLQFAFLPLPEGAEGGGGGVGVSRHFGAISLPLKNCE